MKCYHCQSLAYYYCPCSFPIIPVCNNCAHFHLADRSRLHSFNLINNIDDINLLNEYLDALVRVQKKIFLDTKSSILALKERAKESAYFIDTLRKDLYRQYSEKNLNRDFFEIMKKKYADKDNQNIFQNYIFQENNVEKQGNICKCAYDIKNEENKGTTDKIHRAAADKQRSVELPSSDRMYTEVDISYSDNEYIEKLDSFIDKKPSFIIIPIKNQLAKIFEQYEIYTKLGKAYSNSAIICSENQLEIHGSEVEIPKIKNKIDLLSRVIDFDPYAL